MPLVRRDSSPREAGILDQLAKLALRVPVRPIVPRKEPRIRCSRNPHVAAGLLVALFQIERDHEVFA